MVEFIKDTISAKAKTLAVMGDNLQVLRSTVCVSNDEAFVEIETFRWPQGWSDSVSFTDGLFFCHGKRPLMSVARQDPV